MNTFIYIRAFKQQKARNLTYKEFDEQLAAIREECCALHKKIDEEEEKVWWVEWSKED